MFYYLFAFVIIILAIVMFLINKRETNFGVFILLFLLFIFLALRGDFFSDYIGYYSGFILIEKGYDVIVFADLFYYLNLIVISLNLDFQWVLIISGAITFFFMYLGLRNFKYSKYMFIILWVLTFQYVDIFNIVRQGISMSIFFYSFKFIKNKQLFLYIIFTLLATFFHYSSVIFVFAYFIGNSKLSFYKMCVIFIITYFITIFFSSNSEILETILGELWSSYYVTTFDFALITISEVILASFILFFSKRIIKNSEDKIIINFTFLFVLFRIVASDFFILHRFTKYFINFYIIGILMMVRLFRKSDKSRVYTIIVAGYFIWYFFWMIGYPEYRLIDYWFI